MSPTTSAMTRKSEASVSSMASVRRSVRFLMPLRFRSMARMGTLRINAMMEPSRNGKKMSLIWVIRSAIRWVS